MRKTIVIIFIFILNGPLMKAQNVKQGFQGEQWEIAAQEYGVETYLGQEAMYVKNGSVFLSDAKLQNGIIEFDIAFAEKRQFCGVLFRMQDARNYEDFYIRPHQSGNPDANQYTPVYFGNSAWQLYHGPGFNQAINYVFDRWMHVKILLKDDQAEFYIDDMEQPLFRTLELKRKPIAGGIGFKSSRERTWFANLTYQATDEVTFVSDPLERRLPDVGTIEQYQVSQIVQEAPLLAQTQLKAQDLTALKWAAYQTDEDGTLNLSQVGLRTREENTIFVKYVLQADAPQLQQMALGYSDRIRIYCNGQLLYSGQNEFRSRDYRYLGTIGYFDEVYLPLKQGENTIIMAVSEGFGGWGLKAKLQDTQGIKLVKY